MNTHITNIKINNLFFSILRYRIHISLIFFFILYSSWQSITHSSPDILVIISYSIWHWALYLFDRAYDAELDFISQGIESVPIIQKKPIIIFCIIISLIPFVILYLGGKNYILYLLFFPITFLYTLKTPLLRNKRIKDLMIIKNLYSSILIWTLSISIILKYYAEIEFSLIYIFTNYFLSLSWNTFAGEVLWDIRDIKADSINAVNTIPVKFGVFKTKFFIFILWFINFLFNHNNISLSSPFFLLVLYLSNKNNSNLIYHILPIISIIEFLLNINKT